MTPCANPLGINIKVLLLDEIVFLNTLPYVFEFFLKSTAISMLFLACNI